MKSAYQLAMERLEKSAPVLKLAEEDKALIAEIDDRYRSRIAERKLSLNHQIGKARSDLNFVEAEKLGHELAREIVRLQEKCESEKEKIRAQAANPADDSSSPE